MCWVLLAVDEMALSTGGFFSGRSLLGRSVLASALFVQGCRVDNAVGHKFSPPPLWFVFRGSLRSGLSSFLRVLSEWTVLTAFVALSHGKRCGALRAPIRTSISLLDSTGTLVDGLVHAGVIQNVTFGQYGVPACPWAIFEPGNRFRRVKLV